MSDETKVQAGDAAAESVAAPSAVDESPQSAPAEGGGDVVETEGKEGEPAAEAKPKPTVDKLTAWSEKLSRRKGRLDQREGRTVEKERELEQREAKAKEILALLDTDPDKLLDQVAKVRGVPKANVYKSWMERTLQENDPNERVTRLEQTLAERDAKAKADEEARAKAAEVTEKQTAISSYMAKTRPYVETVLPKYPHLAAYTPESVWQRATSIVISNFERTGQEIPLDKVLADLEANTAADYSRIEAHRQRGSGQQEPTNSERAGAVKSAQPETRKRSISNQDAASRATPGTVKDILEMSDKELTQLAVEELRRADSRWR
ncbi:MAG: hypothetical protein V4529_16455 [Gemmatimonadota bacterium]